MKRILLVIASGLAAALLSQALWFGLRSPEMTNSNPNDLSWLKSELQLSEAQYTRICAIHENSSTRIALLASQVSKMKQELDSFEEHRRSTGEIDFLKFARFVEMRRAVDLECKESTRQVVQASAGQMTPEQRDQYLRLITPLMSQDPVLRN